MLVFPLTAHDGWSHVADVAIGKPLAIVGLIALAFVLRWLLGHIVDRIVRHAERGVLVDRFSSSDRRVQRAKTMGDLLKSIVTGVIVAVVGTMVLAQLGVNIAPIIASAGIIGIALGFGAQSLVKDFLSGVFMIFEDQYGVGDVVDVGVATGTIEAVSMRVTRLRDLDGTVWYVPNGQILRVGNKSQNWSRAVIDVQVAPDEDLTRVHQILREVAHEIWADTPDGQGVAIEEPEVTGVEDISPTAATLRMLVKTAPMQQWGVARDARARIQARLSAEGIRLPTPVTMQQ